MSNSDGALRPGMFIHVRVHLPVESDVIALPQTAVTISLYGTYVYVIEKARAAACAAAAPAAGAAAALARRRRNSSPSRCSSRPAAVPATRSRSSKGVTPGEMIAAGQNRLANGSLIAIDKFGAPP